MNPFETCRRSALKPINFDLKFVPAGTGSAVWDDPFPSHVLNRFMPRVRAHGPMIGIVHLGQVRPTPNVLRDIVLGVGEDVRAGKYGDFTLFVSSDDEATRCMINDIAAAADLSLYVTDTSASFETAQPAGNLTARERETLTLVYEAGGTVTAAKLAETVGIEQTTAGNRLVALHKKGYLQRVAQPHPVGDLFIDPRSIFPAAQGSE